MSLQSEIALEAKDLLPETWTALSESSRFGDQALLRFHDRTIKKVFGVLLTDGEIDVLDYRVQEYVGKRLALALLDPAYDYWSKQVMQHTAGERESKMYQDRAKAIENLRKQWTTEIAGLWPDVQPLIPIRPGRAADAPRVIQAGDTVAHATANPADMEPMYGPLEDVV